MTYSETLEYLFTSAPLFQNIGAGAYKEGLSTTEILDDHFGHPHRRYPTIHVAGTNGKGSTSHTLAAVLQSAGLRVGLYTSPHLVDFRERIRVDGKPIPEQRVIDFVADERTFFEPLHPSFFELTTALAFKYFEEEHVDISVVEVGLGGRLDCTNILSPILSVITNISLDHTQFLGNTLSEIAVEKAGIIKPSTPVVVGQADEQTRPVFILKAQSEGAPLFFAEEEMHVEKVVSEQNVLRLKTADYGMLDFALTGRCQEANACTILSAIRHLPTPLRARLTPEAVHRGFAEVCMLTGLMGRWQCVNEQPRIVCDTGHNLDAWRWLSLQLLEIPSDRLHVVFGASGDKDVRSILRLLPHGAHYYFTQASVQRALPATELAALAAEVGIEGATFSTVEAACCAARAAASLDDTIFVGGSSFVVADFLHDCGQ